MRIRTIVMAGIISLAGILSSCKSKQQKDAAINDNAVSNVETDTIDDGADVFNTKNGTEIRMYCIKHGSIRMKIADKWLYVDPVTTGAQPETDYTEFPKADFILVTHDHYDHLDSTAVSQLWKDGTQVICNNDSRDKLGFGDAMANGDSLTFGDGWTVNAVPAYNNSPEKLQFHPQGRDNGYILTIDGFRIYIAGDTEDIPEMEDVKDIDVAFLPCNLPFTMTPEQLQKVANTVKPEVLFPYHYGDTDMQQVTALLEGSGIDVRIRQYQ